MPKIYLASSALIKEGFESKRTIEETIKNGFDGVQLYLDVRYRNPGYVSEIIRSLRKNNVGVIFHLPNEPTEDDKDVVRKLHKDLPKAKFLIHYEPLMKMPVVEGISIGWENTKSGSFDKEHIKQVKDQVKKDKSFLVFDAGRIAYAGVQNHGLQSEIIDFIREEIKKLDPKRDILHIEDKDSWENKFRGHWKPLGSGILSPILPSLQKFSGIIVVEHEDLELAIESLYSIRRKVRR